MSEADLIARKPPRGPTLLYTCAVCGKAFRTNEAVNVCGLCHREFSEAGK